MKKLTLGIFIFSIILYSSVIFGLLPPEEFFKYPVAAQHYLTGQLEEERLLDFSPLYLYFHVVVQKYFSNPNSIILGIHILLAACSVGFLFRLLQTFFTPLAALLGTLMFLFNHSVILYTSTFEPEPFVIFFLLGFLVFSLQCHEGTKTRRIQKLTGFQSHEFNKTVAGIFLGGSLLTRSNFFPLILITPLFFWLKEKNKQHWLRSTILFGIPVVAALLFLTIRNTVITGSFTPFSMNPGYVFFEGNNPNSTGESAIYPPLVFDVRNEFPLKPDFRHEIYRFFARRITAQPLSVAQVNAYWSQKAKNFIIDHPGYFLKRLLAKVNFVFHHFRRHDISSLYRKDEILQQQLPSIPYALLSAMALVGMILSVKAWKEKLLIYTAFLAQFGIMLLTYVSDRQRVAIMAIMIFFASRVIDVVVREKRALVLPLLIITLAPFLFMPNDVIRDSQYIAARSERYRTLIREALQGREKGHLPRAAKANAMAYAVAPWFPDDAQLASLRFWPKSFREQALENAHLLQEHAPSALFDLAVLYLENGKFSEAEAILTDLIDQRCTFNRRYAHSSQPYFYLARIYERREEPAKAVFFLEQALDNNPGDPWVLSHLTALTHDTRYREKLFRYFDDIDAEFFLGRAYLATSKFKEAVKSFDYVVEKLPEYRNGFVYLSLALGATGNYEQAAEYYIRAITKRSDYVFHEKETLHIFRAWVEQHPENSQAKYYLGIVLQQFGYYEEALNILKDVVGEHPNPLELQEHIHWLEHALPMYNN